MVKTSNIVVLLHTKLEKQQEMTGFYAQTVLNRKKTTELSTSLHYIEEFCETSRRRGRPLEDSTLTPPRPRLESRSPRLRLRV